MIVYIEGVDGSGKSTFAKAITTYLQEKSFKVHPKAEKLMVTHPWRPDRINKENLVIELRRCLTSPEVFIVDRGELSDIIYRTFDNDKYQALMSLSEYYNLVKMYSYGYIMVHCDSDRSEQLMLDRGEDNEVSIKEHQKLRYLFNQIMPLFHAIEYDAAKGIASPDYLPGICEKIRMIMVMRGVVDNESIR